MDVAILVLGMFIGGDPPTAKDAHAVWQSQLNEASSFLAGREYLKAEAAYGGALKTASELEPSELYRGITLNDLGILFQDLGRYIDAEKLFLQSLSVLERRYGTSDRVVVRAGANLVSLYLETQQITKAESILLPLIPSQESVPAGPDGPILLSDLASVRAGQGRLEAAELLFRRVIDALDKTPQEEYREELAIAMTDLSEVYKKDHRFPEALEWAARAERIMETVANPFPRAVIKILNNLAEISAESGKLPEAAGLFVRAINYTETTLGREHPVLGGILRNYAAVLHQTKNRGEARKIAKRANAILEKSRRENLEGYTIEASVLANPSGKPAILAIKP
ncbi:MAG TPA: tetratricopeptide repeat protein [Bryobacteraceae bacterium]|nr:tetratricopeptide repeat protein [Bryobacteraceae bacterium]